MSYQLYPSDLADREWNLIKRLIPPAKTGGRRRSTDMRLVLNAIFHLDRTGCAWRYLPREYPPWETVYGYFRRWRIGGVLKRIHDRLRSLVRRAAGRESQPSAAVLDSQSVRTTDRGGAERGDDAGKRVAGRKQHLLVDVLGLVLVAVVHAASVQDYDGARRVLEQVRSRFSRLRCIWADSIYERAGLPQWVRGLRPRRKLRLEVVRRREGQQGAPFEGEDARRRVISIRESEPPPLSAYVEGIPERLEEIVRKALAKEPGERYQGAGDLLIDLRGLKRRIDLDEEMVRSGSHEWAGAGVVAGGLKSRRRGLLIALVVLTLLTAGGAFGVYRWLGRDRALKASGPATKIVPFTSFPGVETEPSFSPDGSQIAFAWNGPGLDNYDVYVKLLDTGEPLRLTSHPGEDRSPGWSPNGRHIAFIRSTVNEHSIVLVPALGGPERILHSVASPGIRSLGQFLSWSPDGKSLAFSERDSPLAPFQIHMLSVESLDTRRLTSPPAGTLGDRTPAISPSGDTLAITRRGSDDTDDIYLMPVSGGEPTRLTSDNSRITGLAWTPDGREIIYSSNRAGALHLWKVPATGGAPERVPAGEESPNALALSRQGKLLAYTSTLSDTNIWRVEVKGVSGGQPVKLISSTRTDGGPQYSPDEKKIVFSSSRTGTLELWTCDADGSNLVRLTSLVSPYVGSPRWSPDGRQIAFDSPAEGHRDIYVVGADGGKPRRLTTETSTDVRPSWSRDGRFVYFGSDRGGEWQVWKAPAEGGPAVQVTKGGGREAFESPDGRFIYYAKDENVPGLWRVPAEGGEEEKVLDRVRQGAWAVWERGVYFVNPESRPRPSIELYDFVTGRTARVGTIEKELFGSGPNLAATADGRWILYVQVDQTESDIMLVENFS